MVRRYEVVLEGIDLSSLTIGAGATRRLALPAVYRAAAWSSEGPLIASAESQVLVCQPVAAAIPRRKTRR